MALHASSPYVLCYELCRCRLPVVQGALRYSGTKPLECFLNDRVCVAMLCAAAVRLDTCDIGEIERVILPPFVRCAEISFLPGFQAGDALAQQRFEFDGPFGSEELSCMRNREAENDPLLSRCS